VVIRYLATAGGIVSNGIKLNRERARDVIFHHPSECLQIFLAGDAGYAA
jgi:hypothetical protein